MRCPFCGTDDTQVKDSRPTEDGAAIRRRRFCPNCAARFTTFERVQLRDLTVIKKTGQREPFEDTEIAAIRLRADKHRAQPHSAADRLRQQVFPFQPDYFRCLATALLERGAQFADPRILATLYNADEARATRNRGHGGILIPLYVWH